MLYRTLKRMIERGQIEGMEENGIAERIQREVNLATIKKEREQDTELTRRDSEIERLKKALEREQEWKPYEDTHNVTHAQYTELVGSVPGGAAHYMSDAEALDWICSEFGFDRSKVTILHEVNEYEINRHRQLRRTEKKIDRRPIYCATDYHYIRFNVGPGWQWEAWNGQIRPFWD